MNRGQKTKRQTGPPWCDTCAELHRSPKGRKRATYVFQDDVNLCRFHAAVVLRMAGYFDAAQGIMERSLPAGWLEGVVPHVRLRPRVAA